MFPSDMDVAEPEKTVKQRFVAFIVKPDGGVTITLEGVDIEEARKVIAHGRIIFENEYENYLRRTLK